MNILNPGGSINEKDGLVIITSLFLAVILAFTSSIIFLLFAGLLLLYFIFLFDKMAVLGLIIISFLAVTSEFYEQYRIYITLTGSAVLIFLTIKESGLKFYDDLKIPGEIVYFIVLLFMSLLISTAFSSEPITGVITTVRTGIFLLLCLMFFRFTKYDGTIYVYIYSLIAVMFISGIRMLIDLYNFGLQNYFLRLVVTDQSDLTGSKGYTGFTIFFISFILITGLFFTNKFRTSGARFFLSLVFIYNIVILILANSRGGILAALFGTFLILFTLRRHLFYKILLLSASVILVLLIISPAFRETAGFYLRWQTISDRQVYWQSGIDIIRDYPFFGVGPDMFHKYFFTYAPSGILFNFSPEAIVTGKPHPHNFFLYFTAENGIPGLITSVSFFIMFFWFAIKTVRIAGSLNRDYYVLAVSVTGIGTGIFVRSFIEVTGFLTYGFLSKDLPFWLVFGILISIHQKMSHLQIKKNHADN